MCASVEETNSHGYAEALKERVQHPYQRVRDHSAIEQKKQKANYDRFTQENTFENGTLVWLHCLNCSMKGVTEQSVALVRAVVRVRIYQGISYGGPVLDEFMKG